MIERILPPEVVAVEAFHDPPEAALLPPEEPVIARAVDKRRREFTTVRHCARLALAKLGVEAVPLVPGERGAPQWPAGVAGSMTHCDGYRAAAVARLTDIVTLGIDAEPHEPLPEGVLNAVARPEERAELAALAAVAGGGQAGRGPHWDRLLFSAKESVYKAWFPLTRRWLGFEEARVTLDPDAGTFTARLLVPGPTVDGRELTGFAGRWLVSDGTLATAIAVPR